MQKRWFSGLAGSLRALPAALEDHEAEDDQSQQEDRREAQDGIRELLASQAGVAFQVVDGLLDGVLRQDHGQGGLEMHVRIIRSGPGGPVDSRARRRITWRTAG